LDNAGTVLIVDDNPNNLEVLGALLTQAGYKVRPALSGEVALRAVEASVPDLILLDVRMPAGMNGYLTCERLKGDARSRDVPVIFISAMTDPEDRLAGFRAGGVDYIAKPFQADEVLARVRTHIALGRMQRQLEAMVAARTEALARSEARYRVLFDNSPIPILMFACDTLLIVAVNRAFTRTLGFTEAESLMRTADFAVIPEHQGAVRAFVRAQSRPQEPAPAHRFQCRHRDGELLDVEGETQRVDAGDGPAQILMLRDVTETLRAAERLQQVATLHREQLEQTEYFDALTGLPNRTLFAQRLRQGLQQARQTNCWMVLCVLDIDAFRPLNETYGAEIGDHLLINFAECLRSCLQGGDTVARLGGDEFALLVLRCQSESTLEAFLADVQRRIGEPFVSDEAIVKLSAGMGVTVYPPDDADPDTLMRHAEQAMLYAKQSGKGLCKRFDTERGKRMRERLATAERIEVGLARGEFVLYYQPKVDLRRGQVVGAEALIRWRHPERGLLPPGAFLPEIEGTELMADLGDWVIAEALGQLASWRAQGLDLAVSVNIAAGHLARDNFVPRLKTLLSQYGPPPAGRLELEVLETSALEEIDNVEQIIVACRQIGVGFSLDDFGTGYSSLTYLRRLSADTLKIDQSFIRDMLSDADDLALVTGVIGLAAAFKRNVIAEGVETVAHGKALLELGCPVLQGYGIARPMPAQDLPAWVGRWPDAPWQAVVAAAR
jgi:diguanylate cyclase (GGDEF)-like protein/PAS domain S-box-containing protein